MKEHTLPVATAFVMGMLGFTVAFSFTSASGREEIGVVAAAMFFVAGGAFLARKHPIAKWYGGAVASLPLWIFFTFIARPGHFETYFPALIVWLVSAYSGTLVGLGLRTKSSP